MANSMAPPTICPKCNRERLPGEDACSRCGLLVARWASFAAAEAPSHPVLDGLWGKVEESWEDDARHARFLEEAASVGGLELAAHRYRNRLRHENDARAQAGLERAVKMAIQLQEVTASEPVLGAGARWLKLGVLVAAALLLAATVWVLVVALSRRP
jgi:hypothetical protein